MKKILILNLLFLVGCSSQQAPKVESSATSETSPYIKKNYAESNSAAELDFVQLTQVANNNLSAMKITYNADATEVKLLANDVPADIKFSPFTNWQSVKIIRSPESENWRNFLVEVFDSEGYEQSKSKALSMCKDVWNAIDNRVPAVVDELATRLHEYENSGMPPMTQHIRYGYFFNLDASHYKDGYPVVCSIAYDKK